MKRILNFGLIVGIISIGISSCGLMGTSMVDRVNMFEDDLNGSRANIIDNIHPDASSYNTANSDSYWSDPLGPWDPNDDPFSISGLSEGSSSVDGTFYSDSYSSGTTIYFEMKDDGDFFGGENWKIMSINISGGPNEL